MSSTGEHQFIKTGALVYTKSCCSMCLGHLQYKNALSPAREHILRWQVSQTHIKTWFRVDESTCFYKLVFSCRRERFFKRHVSKKVGPHSPPLSLYIYIYIYTYMFPRCSAVRFQHMGSFCCNYLLLWWPLRTSLRTP